MGAGIIGTGTERLTHYSISCYGYPSKTSERPIVEERRRSVPALTDLRVRPWDGRVAARLDGNACRLAVACHPATKVGHFVPFCFCPRSVMLFILHKGNRPSLAYANGQLPIIHLEADLYEVVAWADAQGQPWAFTDRNAGSGYFQFFKDVNQLRVPVPLFEKKDRTEPSRSLPARCGPIVVCQAESVSTWTGERPVQSGVESTAPAGLRPAETQVVVPVLRLFLLRFADRQFLALLFQLPPRITRFEALAAHRQLL